MNIESQHGCRRVPQTPVGGPRRQTVGRRSGLDARRFASIALSCRAALLAAVLAVPVPSAGASGLERVRVNADGTGFVLAESGRPFLIWGVNYDRDYRLRLLEEYWFEEWDTVVRHFERIRDLGANAVRIHLQLGAFMTGPTTPNEASLERLGMLGDLAEELQLYLNITGLGCYHKADVPAWYDTLDESGRWEVQARFWKAVARVCAGRPAVFCYDLMNEPVITEGEEWLPGDGLTGKHYVQRITRKFAGRDREEIADAWAGRLVEAIRREDPDTLITVGVIPWALVWPNARPLFYSERVKRHFDFVSVHFYPRAGQIDRALEALRVYQVGLPIVIEEMGPLHCSLPEFTRFVEESREMASGWFMFFWGKTIEQYRKEPDDLHSALMAVWLEYFRETGPAMLRTE
jgi:hypothetical protein